MERRWRSLIIILILIITTYVFLTFERLEANENQALNDQFFSTFEMQNKYLVNILKLMNEDSTSIIDFQKAGPFHTIYDLNQDPKFRKRLQKVNQFQSYKSTFYILLTLLCVIAGVILGSNHT